MYEWFKPYKSKLQKLYKDFPSLNSGYNWESKYRLTFNWLKLTKIDDTKVWVRSLDIIMIQESTEGCIVTLNAGTELIEIECKNLYSDLLEKAYPV